MRDIKLTIGGRELLFGRAGFMEHIQDAIGKDPYQWMQELADKKTHKTAGSNGEERVTDYSTKDVAVFAYAALNLSIDMKGEDNTTFEKVRQWCRTCSYDDLKKITEAAVACLLPEEVNREITEGEGLTQAVN